MHLWAGYSIVHMSLWRLSDETVLFTERILNRLLRVLSLYLIRTFHWKRNVLWCAILFFKCAFFWFCFVFFWEVNFQKKKKKIIKQSYCNIIFTSIDKQRRDLDLTVGLHGLKDVSGLKGHGLENGATQVRPTTELSKPDDQTTGVRPGNKIKSDITLVFFVLPVYRPLTIESWGQGIIGMLSDSVLCKQR